MTVPKEKKSTRGSISRRKFLKYAAVSGIAAAGGFFLGRRLDSRWQKEATFIATATDYNSDLSQLLRNGLAQLAFSPEAVKGKRVLIKPNLVEPHAGHEHINTHPSIVLALVEVFMAMDAAEVIVAEGAGHRRDALLILEESGLADVLAHHRIPFIDLNTDAVRQVANNGGYTTMKSLFLPRSVLEADLLVSVAKMKTHHWAGVTLSMKNLFGIMPGSIYGWPKNVLHQAGIQRSILDINATVRPQISIVDGIIGMDGDGPIMGTPVASNVVVMGRNSAAVDATSARIMGINPDKIPYLKASERLIGTISPGRIEQRGASIESVRKNYRLVQKIPAHRGIRL